jgi:hypothetical protein
MLSIAACTVQTSEGQDAQDGEKETIRSGYRNTAIVHGGTALKYGATHVDALPGLGSCVANMSVILNP